MKFETFELRNKSGTLCSISNMLGYWNNSASYMDLSDTIEDAKSGTDLCLRLKDLDLLIKNWVVDRDTDKYLRLKNTDVIGNINYLIIKKTI